MVCPGDLPAAQSACRRFVAEKMNFGFLAIVCYGQWLPPPRAVFAGSSWRASMNAIAWLRRVRPLTLGRWRWARTEEGFSGRLVVVRPPVGFRHALTTCCLYGQRHHAPWMRMPTTIRHCRPPLKTGPVEPTKKNLRLKVSPVFD